MIDQAIQDLNRKIDEADASIIVTPDHSVIFIGITGSGKSTILNYLSGDGAQQAVKDRKAGLIIEGGRFKTGNHIDSLTTIPEFWMADENTFFWDMQGFNDNRSPEQEIVNSYCLKRICKISKKCKIVLVLHQMIFNRAGKIENFYELCSQIQMSVPDLNTLSKCLVVVMTCCPPEVTSNDIVEDLQKIQASIGFKKSLDDFFNLLKAKGIEGNIACFPRPEMPGPIDKSYRFLILQSIERASYVSFQWEPIVRNSCKLYVEALLNNVKAEIRTIFFKNIEILQECTDIDRLKTITARMEEIVSNSEATEEDFKVLFSADKDFIIQRLGRAQNLQNTIDSNLKFGLSLFYNDIKGYRDKLIQRISYLVQNKLESKCNNLKESLNQMTKEREAETTALKSTCNNLNDLLTKMTKEREAETLAMKLTYDNLNQKDDEISDLKLKCDNLKISRDQLKQKKNIEISGLKSKCDNLKESFDQLKQQKDNEILDLESKCDSLTKSYDKLKQQKDTEVSDLKSKYDNLAKSYDQFKQQKYSEISDLKSKYDNLTKSHDQLKQQKDSEISDLKSRYDNLSNSYNQFKQQKDAEVSALNSKCVSLSNSLNNTNRIKDSEISSLRLSADQLRSSLSSCKADKDREVNNIRSEMQREKMMLEMEIRRLSMFRR